MKRKTQKYYEHRVMHALREYEVLPKSRIAYITGLHLYSVNTIIDNLVNRGLVSVLDGKIINYYLTEEHDEKN
jgi:predicted transcriptional regulator